MDCCSAPPRSPRACALRLIADVPRPVHNSTRLHGNIWEWVFVTETAGSSASAVFAIGDFSALLDC